MASSHPGSIHLFRWRGIDVFLHWLWFVVAIYSISDRVHRYSSPLWAVLEYLALFLIVLLHEFGHALACRSVGGQADRIVLWPLGGIAFVDPPSRPGATLWSIAAGPLVNVALVPLLGGLYYAGTLAGWNDAYPNFTELLFSINLINAVLLGFNLLPCYPLDGGQILRSLLWFVIGRSLSLLIAAGIGLIGGAAALAYVLYRAGLSGNIGSAIWPGAMALFLLSGCWRGFQHARHLRDIERLPRRAEFKCPQCHASPPIGVYWNCAQCGWAIDLFENQATCPRCSQVHPVVPCPDCKQASPYATWAERGAGS